MADTTILCGISSVEQKRILENFLYDASADMRGSSIEGDGSRLFSNARLILGVAWAQASRDYMQDSFSLSLGRKIKRKDMDFFGVFDGHGPNGEDISRFLAYKLCGVILGQYRKTKQSFAQCIETGCLMVDRKIRRNHDLMEDGKVTGGSTACVCWMIDNLIYSCNVGDSRFILSYDGKAVPVTEDNKPYNPQEKKRIKDAGGYIYDGRVNGVLAVSRAFGDVVFKELKGFGPHEQLVSAVPDVRTVVIEDKIDFLVIATDGVFDIMDNQDLINFIIRRMQKAVPLNAICEQVIAKCHFPVDKESGLGPDNMTIMIVVLR